LRVELDDYRLGLNIIKGSATITTEFAAPINQEIEILIWFYSTKLIYIE